MKGWIFGDEKQKTWTQKIYKHTSKFQNPLHQNYKHVKTIESALGIDHSKIFSVIVFVGDSTFKTKMPENVTYAGGFIGYIKSKTDKIIPQAEVNQIVTAIESGRLSRTLKTHREHVKHVQNIVKKKKIPTYVPSAEANWSYALQSKVRIKEMSFMAVVITLNVGTPLKSSKGIGNRGQVIPITFRLNA